MRQNTFHFIQTVRIMLTINLHEYVSGLYPQWVLSLKVDNAHLNLLNKNRWIYLSL